VYSYSSSLIIRCAVVLYRRRLGPHQNRRKKEPNNSSRLTDYTQGCKWGGTQGNAVSFGVFTVGTPFRLFCMKTPESRRVDRHIYFIKCTKMQEFACNFEKFLGGRNPRTPAAGRATPPGPTPSTAVRWAMAQS
jgi:hypothetical protein